MKLKYNPNERIIYTDSGNKENTIIEKNSPSRPLISPDKKKAIYISPFEWEQIGEVYLIDLNTFKSKLIYKPQSNNVTPKDITWINNNEIAMILGYPYGTIAVGGDIYKYEIYNEALNLLSEFPDKIQITNIEYENSQLLLKGKEYIDDNYLETEKYLKKMNI